jgi:hypothetical protein
MKCLGYFFLLCGLLNAAAWGQSARKNQAFVVVRCADLSCIASAPSVAGKNNPEVKVGTFKPLPTVHPDIRTAKHESARKNQALVVLRCADLSCIASTPSVAGKNNPEVKVGTFR